MTEDKYSQLIQSIKAPRYAVDKAVEGMYEYDRVKLELKNKPKHKGVFGIAVTAAVLCLVLLSGLILHPHIGRNGNVFVINAGATELNNYELTELGELNCESSAFGLGYNEKNELNQITVVKWLDFPVTCVGENIEKITYKANGKSFFLLREDAIGIYNKEKFKDNKAIVPYVNSEELGFKEKLSAFTTELTTQNQELLLCMYTNDNNGRYCQLYSETMLTEGDAHDESKFDYQQMYYELYGADGYSVDITATFSDGSTMTKTVNLIIEKVEEPASQTEMKSTLVVSAILAE